MIRRPVEEVFDFIADERNEPAYNRRLLMVQKMTPGPIGTGTRWLATVGSDGRPLEMDMEIVDYDRPYRLGTTTHTSTADIRGAVTFRAEPGGTRMSWSWDVQPKGALKLLGPVFGLVERHQEEAIWAGLKRLLEPSELLEDT